MLSQAHRDSRFDEPREFHCGQKQETEYFLLFRPLRGERIVFNMQSAEFVLIGRLQENTISLNDPKCSRLHCELTRTRDGRWTLHDMNSANGTFVNDRRLTHERCLADGDVIRIGDVELIFTEVGPTAI